MIDRGERLGNPAFFSLQFPLCHQETLQFRGGLRFRLAQVRKLSGNFRLQTGGFTCVRRADVYLRLGFREVFTRRLECGRRFLPSQMQLHRFMAANVTAQPAISCGLTSLAFQSLELTLKGDNYVVETLQVRFRGPQAEFGLVAS